MGRGGSVRGLARCCPNRPRKRATPLRGVQRDGDASAGYHARPALRPVPTLWDDGVAFAPPCSRASPSMYSKILPTKLNPPAADARQVLRAQVTDRMVQPGAVRLVLVRAPAGFGKTTVMAQARQRLKEEGVSTGWLTLDPADNDLSRFIEYLHAAMKELLPDDAVLPLAEAASLGEGALALIERVAAIDFPFVFFLDEFEVVHSEAVLALVGQLVERLPPGGRLVIGSRAIRELRLARIRAAGQLIDIDPNDLRFSLDETRSFFHARQPGGLGAREVSVLHAKTEGWAAALWLAWLALERNSRRGDFIAAFSGTETGLATYLAEEVLSQQRETVRDFLLRTSILNEVSVPLCQALMPELDSHAILRELAAADVFLIPIERQPGAWRYHSLFASFLQGELGRQSPLEVPRLHEAAAGAYLRFGRPVPAIEHLLAGGKTDAVIALMREQAMPLLAQGRLRLLTRWLDASRRTPWPRRHNCRWPAPGRSATRVARRLRSRCSSPPAWPRRRTRRSGLTWPASRPRC